VVCAPIAGAFLVAYLSQIVHGMTAMSTMAFVSVLIGRPSHDQSRTVLDVVKVLAALDPSGFGLDDICAQLIGSTYVMADEGRPHFLR